MLKTMAVLIFLINASFQVAFFSGSCILFTLGATLVTLLELIFGVVFGPIFSS